MNTISWEQFEEVGIIAGTIIEVMDFPEANKPAYKLRVDCGEFGIKQSSAQITYLYTKEELVHKQVICVVNFAPKKIGPWTSEVLVTGFYREDGVVLCVPDKPIHNGARLA